MEAILTFFDSIVKFFGSESFGSFVSVLKAIFIILSIVFAALIVQLLIRANYFRQKVMQYRWYLGKHDEMGVPDDVKEGVEEEIERNA